MGNSNGELTDEELQALYSAVEDSVNSMSLEGKSSREIYGEIFTRVRTALKYTPQGWELYDKYFANTLKGLDRRGRFFSPAQVLDEAINYFYDRKVMEEIDTFDLELSSMAMEACIKDAQDINAKSESIATELIKIDRQLQGENNV